MGGATAATSVIASATTSGTPVRTLRSRPSVTRSRLPARTGSTTTATPSSGRGHVSKSGVPSLTPQEKTAVSFAGVLSIAAATDWIQ